MSSPVASYFSTLALANSSVNDNVFHKDFIGHHRHCHILTFVIIMFIIIFIIGVIVMVIIVIIILVIIVVLSAQIQH